MFKALSIGIAAVAAMVLLLGQGPRPAEAATTFYVTSNADSGPGTFRAAVDQANYCYDSVVIKFLVSGPVNLQDSVEYDCDYPITLSGRLTKTTIQESNIVSTGDADTACSSSTALFESTNGADVTLLNLIFQYNNCGSGVSVFVDEDYDTTYVTLNNVILRGNDRQGLYVYEEDEYCDDYNQSIDVTILNSTAIDNGDNGVRVREYGYGNLTARVSFSQFKDNGEAGLLVAEHCDGDLFLTTLSSAFNDNYEDGILAEESGDGKATASLTALDASRNGDDGVVFNEDDEADTESLDTAAHTDEDPADDGADIATCYGDDLSLTIAGGRANDNGEDGIDVDEDDCGTLYATFTTFVANNNDDDGIDLDEESGGDLVVRASTAVQTSNNGRDDEDDDGNGIQLDECGYGSIDADLSGFTANANGNFEGSGDGIDIDEDYKGSVTLTVKFGTILSNLDDGVDVQENGCGDLTATFSNSGVNLNASDGFELYQEDCGGDEGDLNLTASAVLGNGDDNFDLDGVTLN
jgi:hypothetical protein